jgi:zinc-ribbon domain
MRPSLKPISRRAGAVSRRAVQTTRRVGAKLGGSDAESSPPAGQDPAAPVPAAVRRGARDRSMMRRRARKLRRLREATARDLGLLLLEMQRRRRQNPELLRRKTIQLRAIDDELRGLAAALGRGDKLDQVVAAGIAGTCQNCGALLATDDRFCSNCGTSRSAPAPAPPTARPLVRQELAGNAPARR